MNNTNDMKCSNCIYREYDSWNNPNGYFCERKTQYLINEYDYMNTRVGEQECDLLMKYSNGTSEYGYEPKE